MRNVTRHSAITTAPTTSSTPRRLSCEAANRAGKSRKTWADRVASELRKSRATISTVARNGATAQTVGYTSLHHLADHTLSAMTPAAISVTMKSIGLVVRPTSWPVAKMRVTPPATSPSAVSYTHLTLPT